MELQRLIQMLDDFDVRLFTLGGTPVTLWDLTFIALGLIALFWLTNVLTRWLNRRLSRTHLDESTSQTIATLVRYLTLVVGFLVIMQTAGINLTTFNVVAGAIGVGVGFGLQNVVSNFICGLIVMFERPVKLGDRIEVDGIEGSVIAIGARATTVLTVENVAAIVPNQKLITETVKNWQHVGEVWQLRVLVAAKCSSDPVAVRDAMLQTAATHGNVLRDPRPAARLTSMSGGALEFELRIFTALGILAQPDLLSALRIELIQELGRRGIALKE